MRLVVYTAVFGNYDQVVAPRTRFEGVSYVCFSEPGASVPAGWTHQALPTGLAADPASLNRWAKMHPHLLFPDFDASVYVDGNIEIIGDVAELARSALERAPIAMYEHPFRRCLYDEAAACARVGLEWLAPIRDHVARYERDGFPRAQGLFEANVIVRAHHDPVVAKAMEYWWHEWQTGIKRDQLSLTYVLWKAQLAVLSLGRHDPRFAQQFFVYRSHRRPWRGLATRLVRRYSNRVRMLLATGSMQQVSRQRQTA